MSGLLFDEIPVVGKSYTKGDWKIYAIHDENNIKGFFGDYAWMSNFHKCEVWYEGLKYPSTECAYQAAKVIPSERLPLTTCSARDSKSLWKKFNRIDSCAAEWDGRKYDVMSVILFDKFYRNKDLRQKLLDTGNKYLEETNHWEDQDWGVDIKLGGKNYLGKILTKIREYWK